MERRLGRDRLHLMRTCTQYDVARLPDVPDVLPKLPSDESASRLDELLPGPLAVHTRNSDRRVGNASIAGENAQHWQVSSGPGKQREHRTRLLGESISADIASDPCVSPGERAGFCPHSELTETRKCAPRNVPHEKTPGHIIAPARGISPMKIDQSGRPGSNRRVALGTHCEGE